MKREIKFRAWDGSKWHFGTYYHGVMYPTSFKGHYVNDILIDENSLGQYTGLKDKNGKEIYEGDVVLVPDTESESVDVGIGVQMKVAETPVNTIAEVVFLNGGFVFNVTDGGEKWEKGLTSFHNTDYTEFRTFDNSELEKEIEVIGNIYENPDLLK